MDTAQWAQGMVMNSSTSTTSTRPTQVVERKERPQKEQALNCPRCNSTNTKFCYYNNYSLTQPRYFCKTCRRYWTEGGSLRNVPVGGGSRKNKKHSSSSSSKNLPPPPISISNSQISRPNYEGQDLNLAFPINPSLPEFGGNSGDCGGGGGISAMELLRSGMSARGLGPIMPMPMPMPEASMVYGSGFGLQDFIRSSTIKFPLDESMQLFPFGDLKQVNVKATEIVENRVQGGYPPMFWNGGNGDGSSW